MDIQAMQSMDWLFKKERIYLLAQFWQQVSSAVVLYRRLRASFADQCQQGRLPLPLAVQWNRVLASGIMYASCVRQIAPYPSGRPSGRAVGP